MFFLERFRRRIVSAFYRRQVTQQHTNRSIVDLLDGAFVEAPCLQFHDLCLLPHDTDAQGTEQPNGTTLNEAFNVLTTDERYMFTKALTVGLDQAGPMRGLLRLHFFKDLGRGWIPIAQTSEAADENPGPLNFGRDLGDAVFQPLSGREVIARLAVKS